MRQNSICSSLTQGKGRIFSVIAVLAVLGVAVPLIHYWMTKRQASRFATVTDWKLKYDDGSSLKGKITDDILTILSHIAKNNRKGDCSSSRKTLVASYKELSKLLEVLGYSYDVLSLNRTHPHPDWAPEPEVCGEKFDNSFPRGFKVEKCSGVPEFHSLLTLVYNFVHYDSDDLKRIPTILNSVNKHYPKLKIIAAVPPGLSIDYSSFTDTTIIAAEYSLAESDLWNRLISKVETKYVYIGRNVVHFTEFDRLERLVHESTNLNAYAVASSFRTLHSGKWISGCEQSVLKNYTLTFTSGYDVSMRECLVCHNVQGPFVTRTEHLAQNPLEASMTGTSGFAVWFLKIKRSGKTVVSCPDSMAFVSDQSQQPTRKEDWTDLARFFQVEKLYPDGVRLLEFECDEANTGCPKNMKTSGLALSHCCMKRLSDSVKLVMRKCKEAGLFCEVDSGTLLGSVKFNGILPWEIDADLRIHPDNYTAFADRLKPYFLEKGYKWNSYAASPDGPDSHIINWDLWDVEVYSAAWEMGPVYWLKRGIEPTVIYLDGDYVRAPPSPGKQARDEYGNEMYKHIQHPTHTGKTIKDAVLYELSDKFTSCPQPEHHACLDQYIPDGNVRFRDPVP